MYSTLQTCGIDGVARKLSRNGAQIVKSAYIRPVANVWLLFVKHRLLPTTHDSNVSKERILLVFSIMRVLSIDVGKIISREILIRCSLKNG